MYVNSWSEKDATCRMNRMYVNSWNEKHATCQEYGKTRLTDRRWRDL